MEVEVKYFKCKHSPDWGWDVDYISAESLKVSEIKELKKIIMKSHCNNIHSARSVEYDLYMKNKQNLYMYVH